MKKKTVISALLLLAIIGAFIFIKYNKSTKPIINIQSVYNNEIISQQNLLEYKNFLVTLPANKPDSIIKGSDAYFEYFSLKDKIEYRDLGFKEFNSFYSKLINNLQTESYSYLYQDAIPGQEPSEKNMKMRIKNLEDCNIKIGFQEGTYYPEVDYGFLSREFGKYLSTEWQEYLKFSIKESNEGFMNDGGIEISWDKIRERIIFLEAFIAKYPKFISKEEIHNNINQYLYFYLVGTGNTPIQDYTTSDGNNGPLKAYVKKSYEKFITINKESQYYSVILDYYNLLKKHQFKVGDYIYEFVKQKGIDIHE